MTITPLPRLVVVALFAVATASIAADDPAKSATPAGSTPAWFTKADKNGDGKLSRDEAPNKDVFNAVDADGDGFVTLKEFQAWAAKNPRSATGQPLGTGTGAAPKATVKPTTSPAAKGPANSTGATNSATDRLDGVEKRPVVIFSDGTRMAGDLYLPANRQKDEKFPAIVLCAGTGGTKGGTQARVAPIFAKNGFVVLAFDYRGWGESESQLIAVGPQPKPDANNEMTIPVKALRWQMNYTDQTEDIRAAISFVAGEPTVDKDRIALWGSSYGGGLVTTMAALDARVRCVAAQVPGMGGRTPRAVAAALDLHTKQARGEIEPVPIETGKMTGKMERYSNMRVNPAKSVGFSALDAAERITAPIIFLVAENEELSDNANVEKVHKGLLGRGVPSAYHVIKGITHYGIYREGFDEATKLELAFFQTHLKGKADASPAVPKSSAEKTGAEPPAKVSAPPVKAPAANAPTDNGSTDKKPATKTPSADTPSSNTTSDARPINAGAGRPADPEAVFKFLDTDKDGLVTEAELAKLKQSVPLFRDNPQAITQFFKRLDADGNGKLTLEEYRKVGTLRRQTPMKTPSETPSETPRRPNADAPGDKPTSPAGASKSGPNEAANLAHFEKRIRPVLVSQCYSCHAADAKDIKGGLALDTRAGLRRGGVSGPAVVPGDVRASLLIAAIRHEDGLEMPPKKKLTDEQIADFVKWIEAGAADPRDGAVAKSSSGIDIEKGRQFWAFKRPVKPALPTLQDQSWPLTEIDRFVRAAQEQHGVAVVADADPHTLVRRLYFDLIGLPPTPDQIRQFAQDWSVDSRRAVEATLDRLLDSSQFGERWGRHWLDVARYAESSGKETSFSYPQAWRFRNYVIDSFNADVRIDTFIREQVAGDLLPSTGDRERARRIVATGFLALGPKSHIERNKKQFEMDLADEQIDAVSQAFLGLTVACARCHDHKFDPIPQTDYYALAGIFRSTETLYGTITVIQNNNPSALLTLPTGTGMTAGIPPLSATERQRLEKQIADLRAKRTELAGKRQFASLEFVQNGILLNTLESKLKAYESDGAPKLLAMGVRDHHAGIDSELFVRGEIEKPGHRVPRGFVQVLGGAKMPRLAAGSGRLELADWIASPDNPLTARVFVNRVWLNLFGRGLVTTPDNFGLSGQTPSHPELLDHLAVTFVDDGWSLKKLIRRIVLSRVYRLDAAFVESNFEKDPENVWLWRMSPRRLDAEAIRDAMLVTAGRLDLTPPVGSAVALGGEGYTGGIERGGQLAEVRFTCRSVYLPAIRGRVFESLAEFDGVDGSVVTGQRSETTVPSQSLYLLNSPYVLGLATSAAQRLMKEASEPAARIDLAYQRWFGRSPTDTERNAALNFLDRYQDKAKSESRHTGGPEVAAWTALCQSLWASGEFLVRK